MAALYAERCGDDPAALTELPIQYPDYAIWQRGWLAGEELRRQLSYWDDKLDGAPALLQLPTDHPRQAVQTFKGAHINRIFSRELGDKLRDLAVTEDCTLFMTLLAAFNVLLSRYSGQTDVVVGSPVAGRQQSELENLIGFFINTLVMRSDLDDNPVFADLIEQVKTTSLDATEK